MNLLQNFEQQFSKINWDNKSREEKLDFIIEHYGYIIFNSKLSNFTSQIDQENQQTFLENDKQLYLETLRSLGYLGDGSEEDYIKLYSRPEIFGETWMDKAKLAYKQSTSIDDFINLAKLYL